MKITYSRNLMTSHMVIEAGEPLSEWEEQMIAHVTVDGILFAKQVLENEQNQMWYDITGKQTLQQYLEGQELDYEMLAALLTGIYRAVEMLDGLLLRADGILLQPEAVFVDYRTKEIYFCYYPGTETALQDAFSSLMESLLPRLNHEDERAVKLAYDAYGQIPQGSIKMLEKLLHAPYEAEIPDEDDAEDAVVVAESVREDITWQYEMQGCEQKRWGKRLLDAVEAFRRFLVTELQQLRWGEHHQQVEEKKYVFAPEEEEEWQDTARPTVLLQQMTEPIQGILRYEGDGTCASLEIKGERYVIGSDRNCEGYLPSSTVSRRHAQITRTGDVYFIEDLNSANGTWVGGSLLDYRTKMSLQKNEVILFADEKFRFI